MAQAYTAPTWTDGSGEGISASNLQAISNALQGIVQGTDKAIHDIAINGSTITFTFVDGTVETEQAVNLKGIVSIDKTGTSGLVDTYTITYTDGTTSTFTVTNGTNSGKADLTLIAPVQTTLTASKAYAVGEQFVYNQVLYKVTQAIASGATITIGTNAVVAGDITSQLKWKGVDTKTGNTPISLPSYFNELLIEVDILGDGAACLTFLVNRNILGSTAKSYRGGYYLNSQYQGAANVSCTLSSIQTTAATLNGQDKLSTAVTRVYYR